MPGRPSPAQRRRPLPQGAAGARARGLSGCRRRLRIAFQSLSRAGRRGLGGAPRRAAGEVDRRSQRSIPHRLYGARVVTHARLALDRRGRMLALALELTGNTGAHTVSYVPLSNGYRVAPTVYDVPVALGAPARRDDQHGADRAVPRRRPAGGDRRHGAADRHRGQAAEDRPGRAAPPQPDPPRQIPPSQRHRAHL